MSLMCYPLFLLYKLLNMFRATMCPSSGADDCVVLSPRVGIVLPYDVYKHSQFDDRRLKRVNQSATLFH